MKVEAYLCSYCNTIKAAEFEVVGAITPTLDMFDRLNSYPACNDLDNSNIHFCMECYRQNVLIKAENCSNRKKDEEGYKIMLKEHRYLFFTELVRRFNNSGVLNLKPKKFIEKV